MRWPGQRMLARDLTPDHNGWGILMRDGPRHARRWAVIYGSYRSGNIVSIGYYHPGGRRIVMRVLGTERIKVRQP